MRGALKAILGAALAAALLTAPPAKADFGLKDFSFTFTNEDGSAAVQAGSHPYAVTTTLEVNTKVESGKLRPEGDVKALRFGLPPGFIGSTTAVPRCSSADLLAVDEFGYPACPDSTAIGVIQAHVLNVGQHYNAPVYNIAPPPGVAAKIGFVIYNTPLTAEIGIEGKAPNNLFAAQQNVPQTVEFYGASLQVWGMPAAHSHDALRGRCLQTGFVLSVGEMHSNGTCDTGAAEVPFLTLPRSCTGPLTASYEAISWQKPGAAPDKGSYQLPGMSGCSKLDFSPQMGAQPTTNSAESASGLEFSIDINDEGLTNPSGLAQSDVKDLVVRMPAGMTLNPSAANGLSTCPRAGYEAESLFSAPGAGCPQASKIGEIEVETPILPKGEVLRGSAFLASQDDNPFGSLIALYVVIRDQELGVLIKRAGKVEPSEERGPNAGRIVTTFEDFPQTPFSDLRFHFKEGARAPLVTPPACGTYSTEAQFTSWAEPGNPLTTTATFEVNSGVNGGPCPAGGVPPFYPGFSAGSINNSAGAYSPFTMALTRSDGEQDMTRFDAILPKGVTGKVAGIAKCSDSAVAIAKAKTGRQELAASSCPPGSEIGHTMVGAGVGGVLTYVPGKLYLGGPFAGNPLSVIAITPAVAGPFDVGTVVVREALDVDPKTTEVQVDGARSDPIPHVLEGIPVKVRDLRVYVDRPEFTLNPTSCAEKSARATLFGSYLDVFNPADDRPAGLSSRYQAASCLNLGFKPRLAFKLRGGTKRGGHPALTATYTPRKGDANVNGILVRLPRSAFLDQGHIRTICTRVQFAQNACPKGAQYGFIRAWTPLLDEPLQGPVWLRSSDHKLPDLVFDLHGLIDVEVATRIDSFKGGIRATIDSAPDAPLSKVVLTMQGAKKGLIVNSRNLCGAKARASVQLAGHNGKESSIRPVMGVRCGRR